MILKDLPVYDEIKDRPNVILMGDGIDDLGMVEGFAYENLLSIGFYNDGYTGKNLPGFQKAFDAVITGDGDMAQVDRLLHSLTD